ncbi:MAG TPA: DUF2851 family protein [Thermomicrobiales bacterium]|nr:DUF2851 family protein [Thermomicrobiales bacterium]
MSGADEAPADPGHGSRPRPRELALSAAWHGGLTRNLHTVVGERVTVIFAGHWTHGFGPDFSDAMLEFEHSGVQSGAVEIHHRTSEWVQHGHHLDARYNDVVLHVVNRHDMPETRREDGKLVPVAVLTIPDDVLFQIDARLPEAWSRLGGTVCADHLAASEPRRILRVLHDLGDTRLRERVTRFEGELAVALPNDVLLEALFDAFGYSENRDPMRELFRAINAAGGLETSLRPTAERPVSISALLLGTGGFLPLSPVDAHLGGISPQEQSRIERCWQEMSRDWDVWPLAPTRWQRARTRPANHPVSRLLALAALLDATHGDMVASLLGALRDGADLPDHLRTLTHRGSGIQIGRSRAISIVASVLLPFAVAFSHHTGEEEIEERAVAIWDALPAAESSRPVKRALAQVAGDVRLRGLGERGHQGLLHLDRTLCTPRRCFECPVAAEVIRAEQTPT